MLILEFLYLLSAFLLALYGLNNLILAGLYLYTNKKQTIHKKDAPTPTPAMDDAPHVTVQLPIFNERHVVERLLKAVAQLDWPVDKLHVQILDDSTDDTQQIIAAYIARYYAQGGDVQLEHIHRTNRKGYKAGALQHGLSLTRSQFVAIFDADFVPPSDFLQITIPRFHNPEVGCVQTRWGHINPNTSYLTKIQALGIDGHFKIEQATRNRIQAFLNFNGTAGVWRHECIDDAGGWQGDTLTEDLDLSYRAQLKGWRIDYQPDMVVPAELPAQLDAFKRQQFRWAKGSIQTAIKVLAPFWRSKNPLWLKCMGSLHLTNYAVHPLMFINLMLTLPMTTSESIFLLLTPLFTLSAAGPPILYWTAMRSKNWSIPIRIGRLFLLIALGTGLSLNNTKAVWQAIFGIHTEFKRTPKFAVTQQSSQWQGSTYALPHNPMAWLELLLALYSLGLLILVINLGIWWLIFWLALYVMGYSYVSGLAFVQTWQTRTTQAKVRPGLEFP